MYDFDKILDRYGTDSQKWDYMKKVTGRDDLIPMWVADMDFAVAPAIAEAVAKRAAHPSYGYTIPGDEYYDSIQKWYADRHSYSFQRDCLLEAPGVVYTMQAAVDEFTKPGDKILVFVPVYTPFYDVVEAAQRTVIESELKFDGEKYLIDFADLERKIKSGVKLLLLCNPHNPLGRVWTEDELRHIADICSENGVTVVSDEMHSDIVYSGHVHHAFPSVSEKAAAISVIVNAPSKTFNIAGLCAAFAITENQELKNRLGNKLKSLHTPDINLFGYAAAHAAYSKCGPWVDELVEYLRDNALYVCQYINENSRIKTYMPEGTYMMWFDFRAYGLSQDDLMKALIDDAKVYPISGSRFGSGCQGFTRMNIGMPRPLVEEAVRRICRVFGK